MTSTAADLIAMADETTITSAETTTTSAELTQMPAEVITTKKDQRCMTILAAALAGEKEQLRHGPPLFVLRSQRPLSQGCL